MYSIIGIPIMSPYEYARRRAYSSCGGKDIIPITPNRNMTALTHTMLHTSDAAIRTAKMLAAMITTRSVHIELVVRPALYLLAKSTRLFH